MKSAKKAANAAASLIAFLACAWANGAEHEDERACDCAIFPFEPQPPCVKVCGPKVAALVAPEKLESILGIDSELATKISALDELGTEMAPLVSIWQNKSLENQPIVNHQGVNLGSLVGIYQEPVYQQYQFVVEKVDHGDGFSRIPVAHTVVDFGNEEIVTLPNTQEFGEPTTWEGSGKDFGPIPIWTEEQLTEDELKELTQRFQELSESEFIKLFE